tara:strand:- start:2622 stop:3062 length:441 start_codon:yes stop_codon:yes gene_type:complete
MKVYVKTFTELSIEDLYNILQLRSEVFVVEQDCVYQDIDGKDAKALHIIGYKNDTIVAYTRIFKPGDYFNEASIGRVVVKQSERKHKYGYVIMEKSINAIQEYLKETSVKISAQEYLISFYTKLGFKKIGEIYLEDGIPHTAMVKN